MPWVVRDAVDDLNRAVSRRRQGLDRMLPGRAELPEGCTAPPVANGPNGRPGSRSAGPSTSRPGVTVYLQTMFVRPDERGGGVGAALVRHVHAVLDARGVQTTLLHYAQVNPLSAPFWGRMGYRPLWTGWEVRPAAALR